MLKRILVANRGEIALRVIRTARAMGIEPVAIHSDIDRKAMHVRMAHSAASLGGSLPRESYLDGEKLIEAARRTGCDAVHPGYGFVSENADFAEAACAAGLVFVGPSPDSLRLFGDKVEARAAAKRLGVPRQSIIKVWVAERLEKEKKKA